ncbi:MAG: FAD-dependent oxidoreductase [Candidatus Brocadiia bacterium]|nr:MAG: FAD-dependent oxidoreductase [Candidatus Brocadiia bacterium]
MIMPRLTIDNREVQVPDGATILAAAAELGIVIPAMCFLREFKPSTSCMVCVVKVEGVNGYVPACGVVAKDGMKVQSETDEVRQARTTALELLLSDHLGDCMGPCHTICPAQMNIPLMIRQIAQGSLRDAIVTVKNDIALPAVLGRICPAPCENGCRRASVDQPVSICMLKRYVADVDLKSSTPFMPTCKSPQNKKVAVIGAGPAGLSAAYYLVQRGYKCTIFDDHEKPGGMLMYGVPDDELSKDVLVAEIELITKLGVQFHFKTRIGTALTLQELRKDFDAVFVAAGQLKPGDAENLGLKAGSKGIEIDTQTYQTSLPGVFAGGDAVRSRKLAIRSLADGKGAAEAVDQYLSSQPVTGPIRPFNTHIGRIEKEEIENFMVSVNKLPRLEPSKDRTGFTDEQACIEARRCMHCDCRKPGNCRLRQYSQLYQAKPARYKAQRRMFVQYLDHPEVIYEPGKCIDCGLCIEVASKFGEELGLTFIGRGFDVKVGVPFNRSMEEGLRIAAKQAVKACPTGALALKPGSQINPCKNVTI